MVVGGASCELMPRAESERECSRLCAPPTAAGCREQANLLMGACCTVRECIASHTRRARAEVILYIERI
jgi:hypothetical protein